MIKKIIALFCIVTFLVCAVPLSSAGTDAKIVITGVKPTELSPGDTKEILLTVCIIRSTIKAISPNANLDFICP
ncbi:hypothetical protein C5S35_09630 [Candidatus Methanophagaceae archaeon]|nr:hypothetical protein C5S35_09630 [Methanophagales archaeon]